MLCRVMDPSPFLALSVPKCRVDATIHLLGYGKELQWNQEGVRNGRDGCEVVVEMGVRLW